MVVVVVVVVAALPSLVISETPLANTATERVGARERHTTLPGVNFLSFFFFFFAFFTRCTRAASKEREEREREKVEEQEGEVWYSTQYINARSILSPLPYVYVTLCFNELSLFLSLFLPLTLL